VIYNISRQGQVELVYALVALADFYLAREMVESAQRAIEQSREIQAVGDSSYLLGSLLLKKGLRKEAAACFEQCLQQEWFEPSEEHRTAAKLEAMTQLQQLFFDQGQKDKLIQLSYDKITLTRQSANAHSENYFHALSLADMGVIHEAFGELPEALEKIDGAISTPAATQRCCRAAESSRASRSSC
jgi:tetratricopeptide (TPR) repeat protein